VQLNANLPIRRLVPADARAYQALRLAALREAPTAFSASYEGERDLPIAVIEAQMAPGSGRNRFGAFDGDALVAMVGIGRETGVKTRHNGFIGGMYVAPSHRGLGLARRLIETALAFAATMEGLRQLSLSVTSGNAAAQALYASMGFRVYGQEPGALLVDGVEYDNVLMALMLAESDD